MAKPSQPAQANPLSGKKVIFATTADPSPYNQYAGPGVVVAVMPGTTAAQVAAIKATGADVAYWDPEVSAASIQAAKGLGITTVIGQVEGPYQLDNYNAAYAAKEPGMTVGTVTSNGSAYYTPNADFMFVESYPGEVPNQTADRAYANAQSMNPTMPVYVVIGGGGAASSAAQQAADAAKYGSYGIFPSGPENKAEINTMLAPKPGSGASSGPLSGSPGSSAGSSKPKRPKKPLSTGSDRQPAKETPLGIQGPHDQAGTKGAPSAYKGGAPIVDNPNDPNDTYSFTDKKGRRVTITTTKSGAKIEQVEGETPYQIKAPDQPAVDPNKPAWHQNPNWSAPDADIAHKANVDAATVLEQRPGANGNTILRLADGTYKSLNADGSVTGAGTWNKDEWESTQGGQVPPPAGATTAGLSAPSADQVPPVGLGIADPTSHVGGNAMN